MSVEAEQQRESREWVREMARGMREADALGICYITADGWCSTHSTAEGPVYYCEPLD